MGTIDLSTLKGVSGRIGPVIAYVTKDGRQLFRGYTKPTNPRTPKQVAQRAKFAFVNKALSPFNKVIKRGHPGNKNAYRTSVGKAYHEAVAGDYPHFSIDYSKIQIAAGSLQLPANIRLCFDPLSRTATIHWDAQLANPSQPGSDNDKVYIVCFETDHPAEMQTLTRCTRAAGEASIGLPGGWQPSTTHFWLFLTSHDLQDNSNSMYLTPE